MIKAIDTATIHKICSGQVVIDLATAVKEMVENSLDSGATVVEVKLRNMGVDSIEVSDNGCGIDPLNYDGIASKHCTSKLTDFEDVYIVSTFGFRGEALNSLCELSGAFSLTTKQANKPVGAHLLFDQIGRVTSRKVVARSVGTSVFVERLFEKLPVRRAEFQRSAKKHYVKMLKVLQSYALISLGVKIVITNLSVDSGGASSKQTVLATQLGTTSLLDTTSIVFGAAFAASLIPVAFTIDLDASTAKANMTPRTPVSGMISTSGSAVKQEPPYAAVSEESSSSSCENVSDDTEMDVTDSTPASSTPGSRPTVTISLTGVVSKAGVGTGRSDNERQFLFLNGRPVDNHKFNRTMNEVWRKYEMKQKPGFLLDLRVPPGLYDVNVTPDKREVMLAQEGLILDRLRAAVDELYAPSRFTFQVHTPDKRVVASTPSIASVQNTQDVDSSLQLASSGLTQSGDLLVASPPQVVVKADNIIFASSGGLTRVSQAAAAQVNTSSSGTKSSDVATVNSQSMSKSFPQDSSSRWSSSSQEEATSSGSPASTFSHSSPTVTFFGAAPRSGVEAKSSTQSSQASPSLTFYGAASREVGSSQSQSSSPTVTFFSPVSSSSSSSSLKKRPVESSSTSSHFDDTTTVNNSSSEQNKRVHTSSSAFLSDCYSPSITDRGTGGFPSSSTAVEMMVEDDREDDPFDRLVTSSSSSSSSSFFAPKTRAVIDLVSVEKESTSLDGGDAVSSVREEDALSGEGVSTTDTDTTPLSRSTCVGTVDFDMDAVRAKLRANPAACRIGSAKEMRQARLKAYRDKYAAKHATQNEAVPGSAETLGHNSSSRTLNKDDFTRMRVVGQFNLGFIVAELDGDLFVMDQHACDEKYKFETLQQTTRIHQQPLLVPLRLETSVAMESVIRENLEVFEVNGFRLRVEDDPACLVDSDEAFGGDSIEDAQSQQSVLSGGFISKDEGKKHKGRVQILSVPFSKSVQFGADGVNELASMIGDSNFNIDSSGDSTERRGRGGQSDNKNYLMLKNDRVESRHSGLGRSSALQEGGDSSSTGETAAEREQRLQSLAARFRLPKLVSMFASRACRSAVMVGTALNDQEMRGIVDRMEGLSQPWNCPHGRPTMRHLVDLKQMK